jgi:hypothetical protein
MDLGSIKIGIGQWLEEVDKYVLVIMFIMFIRLFCNYN